MALDVAIGAVLMPDPAFGVRRQDEIEKYEVRPVRTVTVDKREAGEPISLTGRIEAEDEVSLAFRISGRMIENDGKLGDRVEAGQVIARLEPQNELNALRTAQANLRRAGPADAGAQPLRSSGHAAAQGWTTRANHDQAPQACRRRSRRSTPPKRS